MASYKWDKFYAQVGWVYDESGVVYQHFEYKGNGWEIGTTNHHHSKNYITIKPPCSQQAYQIQFEARNNVPLCGDIKVNILPGCTWSGYGPYQPNPADYCKKLANSSQEYPFAFDADAAMYARTLVVEVPAGSWNTDPEPPPPPPEPTKCPKKDKFETAGQHTWVVPTDVTHIDVCIVGAGGGGDETGGGHAGAERSASYDVTPGESIIFTVGAGGTGKNGSTPASDGENTSFKTITANGGTAGGFYGKGDAGPNGCGGGGYSDGDQGDGGYNSDGGMGFGGEASSFGDGGDGSNGASSGKDGGTGAGGGGAPVSLIVSVAGGNGGDGAVWISYMGDCDQYPPIINYPVGPSKCFGFFNEYDRKNCTSETFFGDPDES